MSGPTAGREGLGLTDTIGGLVENAGARTAGSRAPGRPILEVRGLAKHYGDQVALDGVDLTVLAGEFVTLLGPSGSGKTTMLNSIAGLVSPTSGRIVIDGVDVTYASPSRRGLGMVFQNYALMPHMTVFENVAFPLRVRRLPRAEIVRRVTAALALVELPQLGHRKPRELSGGQQQRVAIARCLVYSPAITLMDEPLGALDKRLREQMQLELKRLHDQLGLTILYVTHDQEEALTISDRIVLMHAGRIEQIATPAELYASPRSLFAAEFVGDSNVLAGILLEAGAEVVVVRLDIGESIRARAADGAPVGQRVRVVVRPENVRILRTTEGEDGNVVSGWLEQSIISGNVVRHQVRLRAGGRMTSAELNSGTRAPLAVGAEIRLWWRTQDTLTFRDPA